MLPLLDGQLDDREFEMTSDSRRAANRRNAKKSTGPRTAAGKASSSRNALRHGLLARHTCLPDEDEQEFQWLRERVFADLQPVGVLEEACCDRIADAIWRLRRAGRLEREVFLFQSYGAELENETSATEVLALAETLGSDLDSEEQQFLRRVPRERLAEQDRVREETVLGLAFSRDAAGPNALGKLSRYEAAIERVLFRNLEELIGLQARRRSSALGSTAKQPEAGGGYAH
jgi:hypothetical protein